MTGVNNAVNAPFGSNVQTILANSAAGSTSGGMASSLNGTFTPVLKFGGATTGITYGLQTGSYTEIGGVVTFSLIILLTSKGSATGAATVTGLPIASRSTASTQIIPLFTEGITFVGNYAIATILANTATVNLEYVTSAAGGTNIADTAFTNTSDFLVTGSYLI